MALLIEAVVVLTGVAVLLEAGSRLLHRGVRPMLPYVVDEAASPRMPALFTSRVQFPGGQAFVVCTDEFGLRGEPCGARAAHPSVLAAGDSQALGWAMAFTDSLAARVAVGLGERAPDAARALAAGGADVEGLLGWARDYHDRLPATGQPGRLNIVVVHLGNDLDEMYYGRATGRMPLLQAARNGLATHSYAMLDLHLLRARWSDSAGWTMPPGANPVLLTLSPAQRRALARATARAALRLAHALPPARQTAVLILPTDYQVARREFDKYRPFYPDPAQFDGWRQRLGAMVAGLDEVERQLADALRDRGVVVVAPREALRRHDPRLIFDRASHHYTAAGQALLAQAIVDAVNAPAQP